jgi:hypothetical protein
MNYWYVSYLHYANTYGNPYRVRRNFDDRKAAEEFISVNAMVHPLPGVRLIDPEGNEVL